MSQTKSAACVLYTNTPHRGVSFLLGMEGITPGVPHFYEGGKWGAFGGKIEDGETVEEGCARETYEETAGCVLPQAELCDILKSEKYAVKIVIPYKKGNFACYFVYVPYKEYPAAFRLAKEFCQYLKADIHVIEKTHLKWFTHNDLMYFIDRRSDDAPPSPQPAPRHLTESWTSTDPQPATRAYRSTTTRGKIPFFRHKMMDAFQALRRSEHGVSVLTAPGGPRHRVCIDTVRHTESIDPLDPMTYG